MSAPAIETRDLSKVFETEAGPVHAVRSLTLAIQPGEIFGLLGPNGAGKTTTLRMLSGLLVPSWGHARVGGIPVRSDPERVRRSIGLVPAEAGHHELLTVIEELTYYGALYGLDAPAVRRRALPLLERLDLLDRVDHRLKTFSTGMRRKVHLIRALLHYPTILLLDEPTSGLDPVVSEEVWAVLTDLAREREVTVVLCSHHLEEVERLCDRVAIIQRTLLAQGTLEELAESKGRYRLRVDGDPTDLAPVLAQAAGVSDVTAEGCVLRFAIDGQAADVVPQAVRCLVEAGAKVLSLEPVGGDLRSLYRRIVTLPGAERAS